MWQDIRYAFRNLRKSGGFALTAVLTLALGIGASTAVFTLIDSVILKPLRYRDSGRLVAVWERVRFLSAYPGGPNPRHFDLWQKRATAFSGLTLIQNWSTGLAIGSEHPQLVGVVFAMPNLFQILEVKPFLGRSFTAQEDIEGRNHVAVLTFPHWRSIFHSDPNVLGKTVQIGGTPHEIIGVLPAGFHFPDKNALPAFQSKQPSGSVPQPAVFLPGRHQSQSLRLEWRVRKLGCSRTA